MGGPPISKAIKPEVEEAKESPHAAPVEGPGEPQAPGPITIKDEEKPDDEEDKDDKTEAKAEEKTNTPLVVPMTALAVPAAVINFKTLYQAYTPENTQQMREYMLYLIDKSIEKMKKNCQISAYVYNQFRRIKPPKHLSDQLLGYIA